MTYVNSRGSVESQRSVFTISYLQDSVGFFLNLFVLFFQTLIDPQTRLSSSPAPSASRSSSGGGGGGGSWGSGGGGGSSGPSRRTNIRGLRPQGEVNVPMPPGGG